jgi:hypothetical protein
VSFWMSLSLERETASISVAGGETGEKDDGKQRTPMARGADGPGRLGEAFFGIGGRRSSGNSVDTGRGSQGKRRDRERKKGRRNQVVKATRDQDDFIRNAPRVW